jgi:hypothetical protein
MNYNDLPKRWKNKIKEYLKKTGKKNSRFEAQDFPCNIVKINFEEYQYDSFLKLYRAIVIEDKELKEIGIFSEHCGYYILSMYCVNNITIKSTI